VTITKNLNENEIQYVAIFTFSCQAQLLHLPLYSPHTKCHDNYISEILYIVL